MAKGPCRNTGWRFSKYGFAEIIVNQNDRQEMEVQDGFQIRDSDSQ